jgi:hypothetical protein
VVDESRAALCALPVEGGGKSAFAGGARRFERFWSDFGFATGKEKTAWH